MKITYFLLLICSLASAQENFSIFFDSNKSNLDKVQTARLQDWIDVNKTVKIVAIDGYTDEDGSSGFNDTLAQKRVSTIFAKVNKIVPIRSDFKTRSYGERHNQSKVKSENRKVTIYYILEKDLPRENEILGIKPQVEIQKPKPNYPKDIKVKNPDGTVSEYNLDTEFMNQVTDAAAGSKLKLDNLNFVINTFAVVPASRGKLYELFIVLEQNPKLEVEIQGHLCCMDKDRQDLSTKRAKAVAGFLTIHGIDKNRISYKGFGVSDPLFKIPETNESERAANRRVEILVVKQ